MTCSYINTHITYYRILLTINYLITHQTHQEAINKNLFYLRLISSRPIEMPKSARALAKFHFLFKQTCSYYTKILRIFVLLKHITHDTRTRRRFLSV